MTESFTAKDIVSIIAACHKNRVKKFKLGELSLRFSVEPEEQELPPYFTEPEATGIEQTLRNEDPFVEELERQTLLMEDPAEYERLMMEDQKEDDAIRAERSQQDVYRGRHSP